MSGASDTGCPLPEGTRIMLVEMPNDPCPIEFGKFGTVTGGNKDQIWVKWDDGRSLHLLVGVDRYEVVRPATDHSPGIAISPIEVGHSEPQGSGPLVAVQINGEEALVPSVMGEDGYLHYRSDACTHRHYEAVSDATRRILCCGAGFMGGTICSMKAGHSGAHATLCPFCDADWYQDPESCKCPPTTTSY